MSHETKQAKWQKALVDGGFIKADDRVEDFLPANWAEVSLGLIASWRKGTLIFTKEKLIYMTAFGISQFSIDYGDIREVKKSFAGFLPMAMTITAYDKKNDKTKKYKFWVTGRTKWIQKVVEKAGISK